jgi:hypothetical protein
MKKIHYRNIGLPKTGTSWLFSQLMKHPYIDGKVEHYLKEYRAKTLKEYKEVYERFDVSINLDTHIFDNIFDKNYFARPEFIHEHTTHITMSLRNPYEVLDSMYNMERNRNPFFKNTQDNYTNLKSIIFKTYTDFISIFDYWKSCRISLRYIFYDDLVHDPKKYMYDICDYIGLKKFYDERNIRVFKTEKNDPLVFDNQETIDYINKNICVIEDHTGRDLSHWKR